MKQLGVLPLPPGWNVIQSQGVRVPKNEATRILPPGWDASPSQGNQT